MSIDSRQPQNQNQDLGGTERAIKDYIDFVFDNSADGPVAVNDTIRGSDWSSIESGQDRDEQTAGNEVMEVERIEFIPPTNADGTLDTIEALRLWDGDEYYKHIRAREFMLGFFGPDFHLTTPKLGEAVLDPTNNTSPADPINSATPKFPSDTAVSPAVINDGTQIDQDFRVRLHVWRWQGTDAELRDYINALYGRTTFNQNITMSNPFTGDRQTYQRADPVRITPGADGGSLGQFTKLTGGTDQQLPKVRPWVTWSENNNATTTNQFYQFRTRNDRVDEDWKELEHDFTDAKKAAIYDYFQVNQPNNLLEGMFNLDERDGPQPSVALPPNSAHQLPVVRPLDGTKRTQDANQLPVGAESAFGARQVVWNDKGGFRVRDDGTSIGANNILIGVQGYRLQLES